MGRPGGMHRSRQTFQPAGVGTLKQTFRPTVYPSASYAGKTAGRAPGRAGRPHRPAGHRPHRGYSDSYASQPAFYYIPVEASYAGGARDLVVHGRDGYRMVRRHRCVTPKIIQVGPIDRQAGPGPRLVYGSRNRCGNPKVINWYQQSQAKKAVRGKGRVSSRRGAAIRSKRTAHLRLGRAQKQQRLGTHKRR